MASDVEDTYLVQRAQEGYLDAYSELTDRHGALAYRVALRLLGNHHDAEDVAQEALITAWQRLPGFSAKSSFSTWLYQIVTRRALNRISRTRATESLDRIGEIPRPGPRPRRHRRPAPRRRCRRQRDHSPSPASARGDRPAPPGGPAQRRGSPHHRQHRGRRSQSPVPGKANARQGSPGVEVTRK